MFNLRMKGFRRTKNLLRELESAAVEIQEVVPDASLFIFLEPESKRKKVFSVSMLVRGTHEHDEIIMSKHEGRLYPMIQSAKRDLIKQLHRRKEKKISRRTEEMKKAS